MCYRKIGNGIWFLGTWNFQGNSKENEFKSVSERFRLFQDFLKHTLIAGFTFTCYFLMKAIYRNKKIYIWGIKHAWENISLDILKNTWHNFTDNVPTLNSSVLVPKNYLRVTGKCETCFFLQESLNIEWDAAIKNRLTDSKILNNIHG